MEKNISHTNTSQYELYSLQNQLRRAIEIENSARDRQERYTDLASRVTFSKKKPKRQTKIHRRLQVVGQIIDEVFLVKERLTREIKELQESSTK